MVHGTRVKFYRPGAALLLVKPDQLEDSERVHNGQFPKKEKKAWKPCPSTIGVTAILRKRLLKLKKGLQEQRSGDRREAEVEGADSSQDFLSSKSKSWVSSARRTVTVFNHWTIISLALSIHNNRLPAFAILRNLVFLFVYKTPDVISTQPI